MRVLITGCAGYIGTALTNLLLESGYFVDGVDNLMYHQGHTLYNLIQKYPRTFKFYQQDVTKSDWLNLIPKADFIIPLAAYVGAPLCDKMPGDAQAVNVGQISDLMMKVESDQTIIYPNSNSGLGKVDGVATEDTPRNAVSLYGRQKDEAEDIVLQHKRSIVFRLATVFGVGRTLRPRLELLVNNMAYFAHFYNDVTIFDGHYRRNYVHVDDVAEAFKHAIDHSYSMEGNAYNLGNDTANCTKLELGRQVAEFYRLELQTSDVRTDPDKRDYEVSSSKLANAGFKAKRSLLHGLKELREYFDLLPTDGHVRTTMLKYHFSNY
jgi:nucleoside-diphosphate-sugar epimerase